jgi:hemolysin activation/secretion protein
MFDSDQRLTAEFITNPHYPEHLFNPEHKVDIYAFAYTIPLTSLGDSIDLLGSYSDTTSSTPIALSGLFGAISGKGLVLGGHYNHNFDKLPDFEQKLSFGYDSRATRSSHDNQGNLLASAITTTPISVTYSGQWTPSPHVVAFSLGLAHNIPGIADHGNTSDFENIQANSAFTKMNVNLDYSRPLPKDWQFHASFSSQFTADSLVSIEKFRVGGVDTVRGFHESELAGDQGFRISLETLTFDFGKVINDKTALRGALFFDMGRVSDNENTLGGPPVTPQTTISSIGTGLRYSYNKNITGRFDLAQVINGDADQGGSARSGDHYINVSVGYMW